MDKVKEYFKKNINFSIDKNSIYASPLKRLGSFIIDLIIISVFFNICINISNYYGLDFNVYKQEIVVENDNTPEEKVAVNEKIDSKNSLKVNFILLIISTLYFTFFLSSKKQATIGNQIFKIMVVHTKQAKISVLVAFIRYVSLILNNNIFGIGYIFYFFREDRAVLQDILSDTRVINVRQ